MPMVSVRIGAIALAVFALLPPLHAARAFGLNLGPFHLSLPLPLPGLHRRLARTEPGATQPAQSGSPALLYPVLAWPSLYNDIFSPNAASSAPSLSLSWPFGFNDIFDEAFAKYPHQQIAEFCQARDTTAEMVSRIERETSPLSGAQKPLLQNLATSLGQAGGYLLKSCPGEIPSQPVARLRLMQAQLDATLMALDIVRPQLQKFEQALNDEQRARLDGAGAAVEGVAPACRSQAGSPKERLTQLEQAVQPTDVQRKALATVEDAFNRAAHDLDTDCPGKVAPTALGRLEATEERLDAAWRAVLTIQVALANFQKDLSDQQNMRLNALEVASTR